MSCVITGCLLVDEDHGRAVWGDLHEFGTRETGGWVFNAGLWPTGATQWQEAEGIPNTSRQLILKDVPGEHFFERRGLVCIQKGSWATLNPAAKEYLHA